MYIYINGQLVSNGVLTPADGTLVHTNAPADPVYSIPWWDMEGYVRHVLVDVETWIKSQLHHVLMSGVHSFMNTLDVILPTVATAGILWYMSSTPGSQRAPKLVGSSLLIYLFYALVREAYGGA